MAGGVVVVVVVVVSWSVGAVEAVAWEWTGHSEDGAVLEDCALATS